MKDLLIKKSEQLTASQKRVLKYIFNNLEESVFLTASALGKKTGVSEATIIRLAQALGFSGFPTFQKDLRRHFQERVTTVSRLEKALKNPEGSKSFFDILNLEIKNITMLTETNTIKTFETAVAQLWKARKILIIGLRSAFSLAVYLKFGLRFLGKDVSQLEPMCGDMWDQLVSLGPKNLVVAISFPRYARMTINATAYAKERHCRILSITDSLVSPLATYSDWTLTAPCQSYSYMDSFTAPMSLIHLLLTVMSLENPNQSLSAFKKLEEIWDREDVYFSPSVENHLLP